jgi:hypothetical protein
LLEQSRTLRHEGTRKRATVRILGGVRWPDEVMPTSRHHAMQASGNHAALEQFVGNGCRHAVEELRSHLWIVPQELDGALLYLRPGPARGWLFCWANC